MVTRFAPGALASLVVALIVALRPLGPVPRALAAGAAVLAIALAASIRRPDVRAHASAVLAVAAIIAAGQVEAGAVYGIGAAVVLFACVTSMHAVRKAAGARLPTTAGAVLLATGTVVGSGMIVGLPRLARVVERFVVAQMFGEGGDEATAFSTTMVLGSTRGMLQSDAIVLRIDGARPDYLRGAVYDRYDGHFWLMSSGGRALHGVRADAPESASTTRITLVRGAPNGDDMRWFLPPGACNLALPSGGAVEVDGFGVARRARGEDPPTLGLRSGGCATPPAAVAPPTELDLDVRSDLRRTLEPIAVRWTGDAKTPRAKLDAIELELGRFAYSLAVTRDPSLDPVVDFVTVHQAGHCEMFASAMVLLARTMGIPARVAGGYHVTEVNRFTGRAVVRDRDAHAWVEAWIDGAWRAWDPTPVTESLASRDRGGTWAAVSDLVGSLGERAATTMSRLGALGVAIVLAAIAAVLALVRWLAVLLARRRQPRPPRTELPPLPCFESLTQALAGKGFERAPSEPVESFATRLAERPAPWTETAVTALLDYARLRYGGIGDEAAVAERVARAAREVRLA